MISDEEMLSEEEDGESDISGTGADKFSEQYESDNTNSSGSSRSPSPKNNRKKSARSVSKPTSKSKGRNLDRVLKEEESQESFTQETKVEPECIGQPNEINQMGILDMTNDGPNQNHNHIEGSGSPTEATENHSKEPFKLERSSTNPCFGESSAQNGLTI